MSKPKTLTVRAAKGMRMPLPVRYLINATTNMVTDEKDVEVLNCSLVRKRIKAGDLEVAKALTPKAAKANPTPKSEG
tara:strand:- start:68 stop:298 length:231 start_codon:yes stop_codon:yes gene_type:complete